MGWQDYQKKNYSSPRKGIGRYWVWGVLTLAGISTATFFVDGSMVNASNISALKVLDDQDLAPTPKMPVTPATLQKPFDEYMQLSELSVGPKVVKVHKNDQDLLFRLSFDSELQAFVDRRLEHYRVDWAGVTIMDPTRGAVLALSSYSSLEPDRDCLYSKSIFPAASVFKIVTASAAISEAGLNPMTTVRYAGYPQKLRKNYLPLTGGVDVSLEKAFAQSANGIFGKVGIKYLNQKKIASHADSLGFNQSIPFDFSMDVSSINYDGIGKDDFELAKLAAGFGDVQLSPIHGAMIAGSIFHQGVMMEPYLVENVYHASGKMVYQQDIKPWKVAMAPKVAKQMQTMMRETVETGTARRSFHGLLDRSSFSQMKVGGKTGSLTSKDPKGRNEWFVGYASLDGRPIAFGIVIVSQKYWKVKPAELAKQIIQYYYSRSSDTKALESTEVAMIGPQPEMAHGKKQKS
ncbi:MAG: penicillin-binding transpeptidase domain-containing protein [Bdellovibrionota bacterium]